MKKIISIDLDGVLNTYNGKYSEFEIAPMREGAKEFLAELSKYYTIEIFTARNVKHTFLWLQKNNLIDYVNNISNVKNPKTSVFIDDRALNFSGSFETILSKIINFTPFWTK